MARKGNGMDELKHPRFIVIRCHDGTELRLPAALTAKAYARKLRRERLANAVRIVTGLFARLRRRQ